MQLENCRALTLALSPGERGKASSAFEELTEW